MSKRRSQYKNVFNTHLANFYAHLAALLIMFTLLSYTIYLPSSCERIPVLTSSLKLTKNA